MEKRKSTIILLAGILVVAAIAAYLLPEGHDAVPKRVTMPNAGGTVVFQHAEHAISYDISCEKCHHESRTRRDNVQRCTACHGATFDRKFIETHKAKFNDNPSCATCHHYEMVARKWGHDTHARELGIDCRECHHKDILIEPKPQNCADCHDSGAPTWGKAEKGMPPVFGDAAHSRCVVCHEEPFAKKTTGCTACHDQKKIYDHLPSQGLVKLNKNFTNCAVCHFTPADKLIPGRMDAFHTQCMGCHEKLGRGPWGKDQCKQCHTK